MASYLNVMIDLNHPQPIPIGASNPQSPGTLQTPRNSPSPVQTENDDGGPDSDLDEEDDEDQAIQTPTDIQGSSDTIAAFTISTARNLQLTNDGERSLLQFSQLNTRLALIHQQAMLIKLSETYSRFESATTSRALDSGNQLVLTEAMKNDIDYRMRLIILSPRLSRYRPLGKVPSTGPGGIVLEWLRSRSGVDKRYFEGEVYKELRLKVKASARYARAEVKDVIRRSVENKFHITVLLREMLKHFEKWFKTDLKTSLALAVRLAFLRGVYDQNSSNTFWTSVDKTLSDIRQTAASGTGLNVSEMLVKCLDSDENKYPSATGSASANITLAGVWQSQLQSSMDEFVSASELVSE